MTSPSVSHYYQIDRDRLDHLFVRYQQLRGVNNEAATALFIAFREGLLRHIEWEESIVFPLFEQATGMVNHGPTAVMRAEHEQIRRHLETIFESLTSGVGVQDAVERDLLMMLSLHNKKEEKILFPAIDRSINDRERNGVFAAMGIEPQWPEPIGRLVRR